MLLLDILRGEKVSCFVLFKNKVCLRLGDVCGGKRFRGSRQGKMRESRGVKKSKRGVYVLVSFSVFVRVREKCIVCEFPEMRKKKEKRGDDKYGGEAILDNSV